MLKIKFSTTTTGGLADSEVTKSCRGILDRSRANPQYEYTNRTGQGLVWNVFRALLYSEYRDLQGVVEFYSDGQQVSFDANMRYKGLDIEPPDSLMDACFCVLLDPDSRSTLKDMRY